MPNRLANTQSLYLRKHAENPIDWWYWCDEALEIAKNENKPIFLSIGYSSCHWCTVMEGEALAYRLDENLPTHSIGLVCQGLSCLEPATSEEQLFSQIIEMTQN